VLDLLLDSYDGPIVAATRTPESLQSFADRGVTVRPADFDQPDTLATAFAGVDRLLLISTDVLGQGDRRITQHRNAVQAAAAAGVKHIIYTSLVNPGPESPILFAPDHDGTEQAIVATGMGFTILRENIYADVLLGSLSAAIQMGSLFSAAGDGKTAYVTREDIAHSAAAALSDTFDGRRTLDLTGPEALSQADLAQIVSDIAGQPVAYVPVELSALIEGMVHAGLPLALAETYASIDSAIAQGRLSEVSPAFEDLTGRKPTSVADFLAAHRDTLLPEASV
jgi:NAD(P)H dehydrogenase (quinone)